MALLLFILHLGVGDGGFTGRAPVDNALAPVNKPFVVEVYKNFFDRRGTALVHGKALSRPVAGCAQLFELFDDAAAVDFLPLPGPFHKSVVTDILFGNALFLHGRHDFRLGGDSSVVGAGEPESGVALHPSPANEDVL